MSTSLQSYPIHSRVHPLRGFNSSGIRCFAKREDELPFGAKGRKYISLVPWILSQKPKEAILLGGPFSNHVVALSLILRENGINPVPLFVGRRSDRLMGNQFLASLLTSPKDWNWAGRQKYLAHGLKIAEKTLEQHPGALLIPMGGSLKEAIPGALTLAQDIKKNSEDLSLSFDHIFVSAGTGMMAAMVIIGLAALQIPAHVHVVLLARTMEKFERDLIKTWKAGTEDFLKKEIKEPLRYTIHTPSTARSYGSINSTVRKSVLRLAQEEGIFADPIYNAKLFHEGRRILSEGHCKGNVLFIHSGGTLSLPGFAEIF